jgi:hypothetical protein
MLGGGAPTPQWGGGMRSPQDKFARMIPGPTRGYGNPNFGGGMQSPSPSPSISGAISPGRPSVGFRLGGGNSPQGGLGAFPRRGRETF